MTQKHDLSCDIEKYEIHFYQKSFRFEQKMKVNLL